MTTHPFNLKVVDHSWQECIEQALEKMDSRYLNTLKQSSDWLPGPDKIFNAFSLPLTKVHYILFGESPYPRKDSANGYAFWDASVHELWSNKGLDKKVNRATSLRNFLKMLLIAENLIPLKPSPSQEEIAQLNKTMLIKTNQELFQNLIQHGFLLLNATLILSNSPQKDAKAWYPFMQELLRQVLDKKNNVTFILLGRIANTIDALLPSTQIKRIDAEHPYNISFITNTKILEFFKPFHLLTSNHQPP